MLFFSFGMLLTYIRLDHFFFTDFHLEKHFSMYVRAQSSHFATTEELVFSMYVRMRVFSMYVRMRVSGLYVRMRVFSMYVRKSLFILLLESLTYIHTDHFREPNIQ